MAKKPDRPVRIECLGVVRDGAQFVEMHITTPRGRIVNAWAIGHLPQPEEGEKRTPAQEANARAALRIAQPKHIGQSLLVLRAHAAICRYSLAVDRLSEELLREATNPRIEKEAALLETRARRTE